MPTSEIDPYTPSGGLFECVVCGARERSSSNPGTCSSCGGAVQNIAIARE
ncbi:rubrerythrin-like domain-containing protein [Halorarum halobium]|nr:rubrerythrin-like domain-containing protein [Halobaculum sp. XH14]